MYYKKKMLTNATHKSRKGLNNEGIRCEIELLKEIRDKIKNVLEFMGQDVNIQNKGDQFTIKQNKRVR
jgi:hypothetical protein